MMKYFYRIHLHAISALAAVCAGSKLRVVLVDSTSSASKLLQWRRANGGGGGGAGMRLWPLQQLQAADRTAAQRKAQANFCPGMHSTPITALPSLDH